jgi:hypothetical protein
MAATTRIYSICASCGRRTEHSKRCGRCRIATHCGTACQERHWTAHRQVCTPHTPEHPDRLRELTRNLGRDARMMVTLADILYAIRCTEDAPELRYLTLVAVNEVWKPESPTNHGAMLFCISSSARKAEFIARVSSNLGSGEDAGALLQPHTIPLTVLRSVKATLLDSSGKVEGRRVRYECCNTGLMYAWIRGIGAEERVLERQTAGREMLASRLLPTSYTLDDFVEGRCIVGFGVHADDGSGGSGSERLTYSPDRAGNVPPHISWMAGAALDNGATLEVSEEDV